MKTLTRSIASVAMAVAVIGGLITSTVLSLLVVPSVFTYVDDFEQWLRRRLRHQNATR